MRLRKVLAAHWLFDIGCNHEAGTDMPVCACANVDLGTHSTVADAVEAWAKHVETEIIASERASGARERIGLS